MRRQALGQILLELRTVSMREVQFQDSQQGKTGQAHARGKHPSQHQRQLHSYSHQGLG
jgi:hypothetical protein